MILVETQVTDGLYTGFSVSGHADYAEHGSDIVCAAVSAVTLTTAGGLKDVAKFRGHYEAQSGMLTVQLADAPDARSQLLIETMLNGLRQIQAQYPERLTIAERRR